MKDSRSKAVCTFQCCQSVKSVRRLNPAVFIPTVRDKIPWNSTRLYRSEALADHSPLTILFAREFRGPFCQNNIVGGQGIAKCFNNFVRGCRLNR